MEMIALLFGLSFVGIGFLMKKYPNMISPYNTMPAEKKKNVDINAIASLYQKGFLIIGLSTIGVYYLFDLLNMRLVAQISTMVPVFVLTPILMIMVQKYDLNKRSKLSKLFPPIIIGVIFVVTGVMVGYGIQPTKVIINDNSVEFTGQYGITVSTDQIQRSELLEHIPRITAKTNGLSVDGIYKGHFHVDGLGRCRLFLRLPNPPYLLVEMQNGDKILFNSPDASYTKEVFEKLNRYRNNQ